MDEEFQEIDVRQAAAAMGRARTPRKAASSRENGKQGGRPKGSGRPMTEETKAKMRASQQARREREQAESRLSRYRHNS